MSPAELHADATRGTHFRMLARKPLTIVLGILALGVAGGVTGALAGAGAGAGAALGAALLVALVVWVIADARAEEDFFNAYAAARSFQTGGGRSSLPPATGLLRKGLRRYTDRAFAGKLAGRVDGVLAYYTYETETTDSKGNRHVQYHNFTVALTAVPEATPFLGEVACQRRSGFRFFDKAEDAFRRRQRVELESEELDKRYEIFIGERDDMNRAKQLFSPKFIDYLATGDDDMGFELEGGMLAINVPGHHDSAEDLDAICAAAAEIAERISSEALESVAPGAERPTSSFAPSSYVSAQEAGKSPERLKRRIWALVSLLAIVVGGVVGFASAGDDDTGGGSYTYRGGYTDDVDFGSLAVKSQDRKLLGAMAKLDDRDGVQTYELYGRGVQRHLVDEWVIDALVRDLITVGDGLAWHLTAKGERAAEQA